MTSTKSARSHAARFAQWGGLIVMAASLAGCAGIADLNTSALDATVNPKPVKPAETASAGSTGARPDIAALMKQHTDAPDNPKNALAYASALQKSGKMKEARGVLERTAATIKTDRELLAALGLVELELGQTRKALAYLNQAAGGDKPDWRVVSGQGIAYSMQGQQAQAQKHFNKALQLSPGNPSILNNLAVSYMLDRKLQRAETLLLEAKAGKDASTQVAQVTQNLTIANTLKSHVATADAAEPTASEPQPAATTARGKVAAN